MRFWAIVFAVLRKDILSELRTKEVVFAVLVFALLVVVIFNLAFGPTGEAINMVGPGILWVTFSFSGALSLNRSFSGEGDGGMAGLAAAPVGAEAIYLGKMLSSLVFMLTVELAVLPAFAALFDLRVLTPEIGVITLLATIGFVSVGAVFSALAANTRARDLVLPILYFPAVAPLVMTAVKSTAVALGGGSWSEMAGWLEGIAAFSALYLVVSYLVFGSVIEE